MSEYDKQMVRKAKKETEIALRKVSETSKKVSFTGKKTKVNLNHMAKRITLKEGGNELNIGDVKEVMKLTFEALAEYDDNTIIYNIRRKK